MHVHAELGRARLDEGPVEEIAVVRHIDGRLDLAHMLEPAPQRSLFVPFIPHNEWPCKADYTPAMLKVLLYNTALAEEWKYKEKKVQPCMQQLHNLLNLATANFAEECFG